MPDKPTIVFNLTEGRFEFTDIAQAMDKLLVANERVHSPEVVENAHDWLKQVNEFTASYPMGILDAGIPVKGSLPRRLALRIFNFLSRPFRWMMIYVAKRQMQYNHALTNALNASILPLFDSLLRQKEFNQALASALAANDPRRLMDIYAHLDQRMDALRMGLRSLESQFQGLLKLHDQSSSGLTSLLDTKQAEMYTSIQGLQKQLWEIHKELNTDEIYQRIRLLDQNMRYFRERLDDVLADVVRSTAPAQQKAEQATTLKKALADDAYVVFEEIFRGSEPAIRAKVQPYADFFVGCRRVLDIGCGRGELLEVLTESGVGCEGIDLNQRMVEICQAKGLKVQEADLFSYLESLGPNSLDGVASTQVVEHLDGDELLRYLHLVWRVLKPGGRFLTETQNVGSVFSLTQNWTKDFDHETPIHPEAFRHALSDVGFEQVRIELRVPVDPHQRMRMLEPERHIGADPDLITEINRNFEVLDQFLYGMQDFAAYGVKPGTLKAMPTGEADHDA